MLLFQVLSFTSVNLTPPPPPLSLSPLFLESLPTVTIDLGNGDAQTPQQPQFSHSSSISPSLTIHIFLGFVGTNVGAAMAGTTVIHHILLHVPIPHQPSQKRMQHVLHRLQP